MEWKLKVFCLSAGCCENASVIGCSLPPPPFFLGGGGGKKGKEKKKERPVTLFAEGC